MKAMLKKLILSFIKRRLNTTMITRPWSILILILGTLVVVSGPASAVSDTGVESYFSSIERMTRNSPLEHAGSHGTIGIGLGAGAGVYNLEGDDEVLRAHWRSQGVDVSDNQVDGGRIYIPRFYFHKGLPWSLDVGVSYGVHGPTGATLAGGYTQWTAFEAFALPAVAIRGGFGRLMGLRTTDASMITGELLASYGFLRIFTVYGGLGTARSQIKTRSGQEYGTSLSLTGSPDNSISRVNVVPTETIGLQVQLVPPFAGATLETQKTGDGPRSVLGKLSIGM
jgi:hypothetical protein